MNGIEFAPFCAFRETFTHFIHEVLDRDGIDRIAVEVERFGMQPHRFGDVEELCLGNLARHTFVRPEGQNGIDFVVIPLADGTAEREAGFALELVTDEIFGDFELILGATKFLPAHDFAGRVEHRLEDIELEFGREP